MTISAGFIFRPKPNEATYEKVFRVGEFFAVNDQALSSFSEGGLRQAQQRLQCPRRTIFSSNSAFEDEPDIGDWELDLTSKGNFKSICHSYVSYMQLHVERLYFFYALEDWGAKDRVLLRSGTAENFLAEFELEYPWAWCLLTPQGDLQRENAPPTLFEIL